MSDVEIQPTALQICKIGDSVGLILPGELLSRLNLKEGDTLISGPTAEWRPFIDTEACAGNGNCPQGDARIPRHIYRAC
jgi:hypothetical protein